MQDESLKSTGPKSGATTTSGHLPGDKNCCCLMCLNKSFREPPERHTGHGEDCRCRKCMDLRFQEECAEAVILDQISRNYE